MSDEYRQNDPDRAGGLISDAQGEFVTAEPGGAFDPRAFRDPDDERPGGAENRAGGDENRAGGDDDRAGGDTAPAPDSAERPDAPAAADEERVAPVNDQRMSSPGREIDKAG